MNSINHRKKIASSGVLLLAVMNIFLFSHIFFVFPASAATMVMGNNMEIDDNFGKCDNSSSLSTKTIPVATDHNNDANQLLPCCITKTVPGQIREAEQNSSEKLILCTSSLMSLNEESPNVFYRIFYIDFPYSSTDQLETIIKRE